MTNKPHYFPFTPQDFLSFHVFFPLLITEMIFPKLAGENTARRAARKHPGKPLQGQV